MKQGNKITDHHLIWDSLITKLKIPLIANRTVGARGGESSTAGNIWSSAQPHNGMIQGVEDSFSPLRADNNQQRFLENRFFGIRNLPVLFLMFFCSVATAQAQWPWQNPNVLEPAGPVAGRITNLWWYLFITASIVFVIVMAIFFIGISKRGKSVLSENASEDRKAHPWFIVGTGLTVLILIATAIYTFLTFNVLAAPLAEPRHTIEVVGKQWWWEVRYEGETIGANELYIPVGETVAIQLRSDNVIHSFWVPQLAGKRDLIPGKTNTLYLRADEPGVYRGFCAEFCGVQHALMGFVVVAEEANEFEAWLEQQRSPVSTFVREEYSAGHAIFQNQGCAGCHAIRGTEAAGQLGPDLTHLASRLTIGAATLPNTKGHLGGWVVNSQAVKPGNYMPVQQMRSEDLQILLEYLEALE